MDLFGYGPADRQLFDELNGYLKDRLKNAFQISKPSLNSVNNNVIAQSSCIFDNAK